MRVYGGAVRTLIAKLLLLAAMLLLPLGMTPAAASLSQHGHAGAMPMPHCPEQAPGHGGKAGFVACTMACSAALPAADLPQQHRTIILCAPVAVPVARGLIGIHPETATPPPKAS